MYLLNSLITDHTHATLDIFSGSIDYLLEEKIMKK